MLDGQVDRTIGLLRQLDADQDTIVVFTSDNGYYLGEHLKRQGKINLHEPSIRVPLLMSGPGIPVGDRYDPVTTLDVARTLAAWGGAELAAPDGIDLRDGIALGDQGWSRALVLEGLMPEPAYARAAARPSWGRGLNTIGVRTGRWKLSATPPARSRCTTCCEIRSSSTACGSTGSATSAPSCCSSGASCPTAAARPAAKLCRPTWCSTPRRTVG